MKQIKLYTLKEDVVLVASYQDRINIHSWSDKPIHIRGSDEVIIDAPVEVKQLQIERYVEYSRDFNDKEHLVAFDPEIRKLLGINDKKVKDELEQMKMLHNGTVKTNETLVKYKNDLLKENEELNDKIGTYLTLTFWQRLVFLFTGKLGGQYETI